MATFVLIHGAGSDSFYWHLVTPELESMGHDVIAPDLPCDDDRAGLAEYRDVVVAAIGDRRDVVLVAQSMGGFTAPLVAEQVSTRMIVLLNAMVPRPGEAPGAWWDATGWTTEHGPMGPDFDPVHEFLHDLPGDLREQMMASPPRQQSGTPFEKPWPLDRWPAVPTRFLQATEDRFFPIAFQRRVVRDRLGFDPDEMPGGHLVALSRPTEVAARLDAYLR